MRPGLEKLDWWVAQIERSWAGEARLAIAMTSHGCRPGDCYRAKKDWVTGRPGNVMLRIPEREEGKLTIAARDLPIPGKHGDLLLAVADKLSRGSFLLCPQKTDRSDVMSTIADQLPGFRAQDIYNGWLVRIAHQVPFTTLARLTGGQTQPLGRLSGYMRRPTLGVVQSQVRDAYERMRVSEGSSGKQKTL